MSRNYCLSIIWFITWAFVIPVGNAYFHPDLSMIWQQIIYPFFYGIGFFGLIYDLKLVRKS